MTTTEFEPKTFSMPLQCSFQPYLLLVCFLFLFQSQGARSEGVEGFFKGIGKGLLGLLIHPAGGVIDMVSFTLDGVRRLEPFGSLLFYTLVRESERALENLKSL